VLSNAIKCENPKTIRIKHLKKRSKCKDLTKSKIIREPKIKTSRKEPKERTKKQCECQMLNLREDLVGVIDCDRCTRCAGDTNPARVSLIGLFRNCSSAVPLRFSAAESATTSTSLDDVNTEAMMDSWGCGDVVGTAGLVSVLESGCTGVDAGTTDG
jgi:hypothetical protein